MDTGLIELLAFAGIMMFAGVFALLSITGELEQNKARRRWLAVALGTGVLSFGLKLGLVLFFNTLPPADAQAKPYYQRAGLTRSDQQAYATPAVLRAYNWQALPHSAPYPADNPPSTKKIALGRQLFFEKRLSADDSLACASCHELNPGKGGADGVPTSSGIGGQSGSRNAPTVLNAAFQRVLFWDGRALSLEEQSLGPLINPLEMGMPSLQSVVDKLRSLPGYPQTFAAAFPEQPQISAETIGKAIAAYERTLITPDSPYDRFVRGDLNALSQQQIRGMRLFEDTGCVQCHSGPNFSAASVFNDGSPYRVFPVIADTAFEQRHRFSEDLGAANDIPGLRQGLWRVPSLRNISRTGPYFHNGSVESLEEAVRIMASLQLNKQLSNARHDDRAIYWSDREQSMRVVDNQALSDSEVDDIVSFLTALNGESPSRF